MPSEARKINVAHFLNPEPPEQEADIEGLFVDRDAELADAEEQIRAILDKPVSRPLVFVGQARVGKSHLLRRLVQRVRPLFSVVSRVQVTPGVPDSTAVLRESLNQIAKDTHNAVLNQGVGPAEGPLPLKLLDDIHRVCGAAIAGHVSELQMTESSSLARTFSESATLKLKVPGIASLFGQVEVGVDVGTTRSETAQEGVSRSFKMGPFSDHQLSELIELAHVLAREAKGDWTTLLVIDDFDLLTRGRDGALDPWPLLQDLYRLALVEGLCVLTTTREDMHENYRKSFHSLAHVAPFRDDIVLRRIYDRHVTVHHGGQDPFRGAFVQEAARRCEGRVGIFLDGLRRAFESNRGRLESLDFGDYYTDLWANYSSRLGEEAAVIVEAVRQRGGVLSRTQADRIRRTRLAAFVLDDYSSLDEPRVEPILLSYLREAAR